MIRKLHSPWISKHVIPAASVLSDGETHDKPPEEPALVSTDGRLPELDAGLVIAVVNETTLAEGCTYNVSTASADGEAVGDDRTGSISFVGTVKERLTPG
jgi:hypothetical protein